MFSVKLYFSVHERNTMSRSILLHPFLNIFSFSLHKKIIERFNIPLFFPPESTQQVFIKVLYNVQTFTSTVPTECRRYHKDCFFLMKRCKATVWYREEIENGQNKSRKGYNIVLNIQDKGHYLIHQTDPPVPDTQGWTNSFNQPSYCTKTYQWLAQSTSSSNF